LAFWLSQPEVPEPYTGAWVEQRRYVAQTALDGCWWGTITSEPGSGGDVDLTRAVARPDGAGRLLLSGQKHFGSGSGVTSFMTTTAIPEGEETADWFFMDVRGALWDGSTGMKLVAEWDGHGMAATQSHAFEFTGYPVTRSAWPANMRAAFGAGPGALSAALFPAVIVGVAQSAFESARAQVFRRRKGLRPYERVEWARVENEWWLISQAYEGMLRSIEARDPSASLNALQAKMAIADLAESLTQRICRVIGGGSFARASHFGAAFEDVRALGFLRPPWALAYDALLIRTFSALEQLEQ
jgi:alkylation response protein AidB-like acyl-CoA dehydrogenase